MKTPALSCLVAWTCRSARVLLAGIVPFLCVVSSPAQTSADGSITGKVRNAQTNEFLEGASVTVEGTSLATLTERGGSFSLGRVPAGHYMVKVFYTGLDSQAQAVDVASGQTAEVSLALTSEAYRLETFTVAGPREGNAASITRQRNAENVMNVVSIDAYGSVSDGNLGNFLQKLPGVAANKEAGEIVGVGLRGTPPELNSVTLDGVRTASAIAGFTPQGDRAALIDQIPSEFIKEIEVVKGNTPDMPADSLGGSVNLVTKSAFDFNDRVITYRVGLSQNTYRKDLNRVGPTAAVSYLDTFGPGRKFGVAVSASYTDTFNTRDRVQMAHSDLDDRNSRARTLDDKNHRVRAGYGGKFEYRFDSTARVFVDTVWNYFASDLDRINWQGAATGGRLTADYNVVSRAAIEAGAIPRTTAGAAAGIAPGFTSSYTEMLNATWTNQVAKEFKRSHQSKIGIGGEKTWDDAKLTMSASFNPSSYKDNFYGFTTTLTGIGLAIDTTRDQTRPTYIQTFGNSIAYGSDFTKYTAQRFEQPDQTYEEVGSVRGDYEHKFTVAKFPLRLKTGFDYRHQHRWYRTYRPTWNFVGADGVVGNNAVTGINDDNIARFRAGSPGYGLFNNRYQQRDRLMLDPVENLFRNSPSNFVASGTTVSFRAPPSIAAESVSAGYLQGDMKFGPLSVLGGFRYESTEVKAQGSYGDALNPSLTAVKKEADYAKVFPSLHLRYEPVRNLIVHTSYSTSSARPAISDIVPTTTVSYNSSTGLGSVTQNNSNIKPQYTKNYDASVEYYFEPAGLVSAGWFHKDVKDFIQNTSSTIGSGANNGFNGNYTDFILSSKTNLGKAVIDGWELNYNQRFTGLPRPFNGLGLFANYTKLRTSGTYSFGQAELARFVPKTYNAGVSYDWRGFGSRLEYHYKSAFLDVANTTTPALGTRVTDDPTVDVNFSYKFRPWLTVFVDFVNIFNNSPDWYTIQQKRIDMSEVYGSRLNVGVSGRF